MTATCTRCGNTFTARNRRARFCSGACRAAASKARASGRPESAVVVELGPIEPSVGAVRQSLAAWLDVRGIDVSDPRASAALALAQRLDDGRDPISGLATAVGALRAALAELERRTPHVVDRIDLLRVRFIARKLGFRDLADALDAETCAAIWTYANGSTR